MEDREPLLIGISWDTTNLQNIEQELIKARIKAEQSDMKFFKEEQEQECFFGEYES